MKPLLTVLTQIHRPAVYVTNSRFLSSGASSGLLPLRDDAPIVGSSRELVQRLGSQVEVRTDFITEKEEAAFLQELESGLKKKRYEFDHWDDGSQLLGPVHVIDLDKTGYIKPHIDSVKFCGSTIAGLSLLSDSIMRLVKDDSPSEWLDLLLSRRSLYILRDQARYNFTHEILKDEESVFNGQRVPRRRRISVICRNLPG
ncbi:alpha-ketoglutarate-dependent dioxygenase alkB homolog 7, mitochondrial isoform X2 [Archocentrus centrarchus]|uniref:alpha-ketoglutarate-dependent dioxygenase alkB homolog 7, mitochondrial isoform X2 n=1 Tax=Archocentrus centrarchus TaxID=63155 RepID=UPI0011EA45BE|nr:alpha-ketoglutarate-dependent dioxygenase alkB homolog 7, mitochondrial isoform X2 [Archocentrus centrarchus]